MQPGNERPACRRASSRRDPLREPREGRRASRFRHRRLPCPPTGVRCRGRGRAGAIRLRAISSPCVSATSSDSAARFSLAWIACRRPHVTLPQRRRLFSIRRLQDIETDRRVSGGSRSVAIRRSQSPVSVRRPQLIPTPRALEAGISGDPNPLTGSYYEATFDSCDPSASKFSRTN